MAQLYYNHKLHNQEILGELWQSYLLDGLRKSGRNGKVWYDRLREGMIESHLPMANHYSYMSMFIVNEKP